VAGRGGNRPGIGRTYVSRFPVPGWEKTWLGAGGTIVLTAALWALLHTNKNWLGVAFIFVAGLFLGWMRRRSGSTILTILLHATSNLLLAALVTLVAIGWIA